MSGSEPDPLIAGRYRLGRRLGRGGMAEVFDAFDERLERPVALKVLRPEVAAEAPMRQRFEAEARAAARFSHPAVVSVYDSGEHAGRTFLIMERLPGETLADRIKRGPVDQRWLKQAATDVLSALSAAHQIGLIHRDIKPGNVLITEDDRVKVADFGIAKMAFGGGHDQDLTQVGMVLGTPAYLAPERLSGEPATAGTDLYALAVVLYEAATGHKPPAGAADATVIGTGGASATAAATADPPLDPALARVIRRAMAPNPADRYPSAEAMAADLARGGGEAVPATVALPSTRLAEAVPAPTRVMAPPPVPPQEVTREEIRSTDPERRRGLAVAAAILVVLIIVVVVALLLTRHHSSGSPSTTTPATVAPATAPTTASTTPTTSTPSTSTSTTTSTTMPTTSTTSTTEPTTTTTTRRSTTTTSSSTTSTTSATQSP